MLNPRVLTGVRNEIAVRLVLIFEFSLASKDLLMDWRLGHTKIVEKSSEDIYRPGSSTCIVCKVLESQIRYNIVEHLIQNKLLSKQYRFFKGDQQLLGLK